MENVGQQIFDNVPSIVQPDWAGLILSRFDKHIEKVPNEIIGLYEIIEDSEKWKDAHKQFSAIRNLTLKTSSYEQLYYACSKPKVKYLARGLFVFHRTVHYKSL